MQRIKTPRNILAEQSSSIMTADGLYPEDAGNNLTEKITSFVTDFKTRSDEIQATKYKMNRGLEGYNQIPKAMMSPPKDLK